MKKIILASITVLSLGLFSFTMPKPNGSGVWLLPDGNYSIDQGAVMNFSQADQQAVTTLMKSIYNVDMTHQEALHMIQSENGTSIFDTYIWFWIIFTKMVRMDGVELQQGTDQYALMQIISQYAQPQQ